MYFPSDKLNKCFLILLAKKQLYVNFDFFSQKIYVPIQSLMVLVINNFNYSKKSY